MRNSYIVNRVKSRKKISHISIVTDFIISFITQIPYKYDPHNLITKCIKEEVALSFFPYMISEYIGSKF